MLSLRPHSPLQKAKEILWDALYNDDNIQSIGLGDECLHLYLKKKGKQTYPPSINGYPVKISIMGKIKPLKKQ